jgi:hypothetical protein
VDGSGLSDTLAAFLCPASGAQAALQPATTVVIIRFANPLPSTVTAFQIRVGDGACD